MNWFTFWDIFSVNNNLCEINMAGHTFNLFLLATLANPEFPDVEMLVRGLVPAPAFCQVALWIFVHLLNLACLVGHATYPGHLIPL